MKAEIKYIDRKFCGDPPIINSTNRINKIEELEEIGFFEYLESGNLCFIEWAEKIEPHLPLNYDHYILKGLTKTIKKHSPIFLIEYNKEYFNNIKKLLKDYYPYIYDLKNNKMIKLKNKINKKKISRTTKENYLSSRNIFYVPKIKKIN